MSEHKPKYVTLDSRGRISLARLVPGVEPGKKYWVRKHPETGVITMTPVGLVGPAEGGES